ncbi:MAG: hypothetical protein LM583_10270 [Desulfurococcaceae archaeon]|nr:hypothetical protein [Desulfurococcaceae archaeon]
MIGTIKEKKIRCENIRHIEGLLPCDEIARACDILMIVLRVLYDSTNIVFFDIDNFDILIWAFARTLLSEQFGEPVIEGLICWGEDVDTCYGYRMIFKCRGDRGKAFEKVDIDFDYDSGLMVHCFFKNEIELLDVEYLKPKRISTKIELVEDEKIRKIVESLRKGSGVEK